MSEQLPLYCEKKKKLCTSGEEISEFVECWGHICFIEKYRFSKKNNLKNCETERGKLCVNNVKLIEVVWCEMQQNHMKEKETFLFNLNTCFIDF